MSKSNHIFMEWVPWKKQTVTQRLNKDCFKFSNA